MRTVRGKFYLKFVTVALCLFSIKAKRTKSRSSQNNASISKIKFWNAISSEILGLKSNITKIWKNLDQLNRTSNDNSFCEMQQGFGEELRTKDKQKEKASYKKSGDSNICSVIRTLNTDVIQLERTFSISIKTINQNHADVKAHLNKTSLKVEELDKNLNSLDNFTRFSFKKHHDELERLNNTVAKNTDELVSIKEKLEGMGGNLQTVLKILNTLKECPSGWTKHDLSCYSCRTESLKWKNAVNTCLEEGAHLVELQSQEEVKFVLDLFLSMTGQNSTYKYAGFLIGGSDLKQEGKWKWESSGRGLDDGFTYWLKGQPDDYANDEDCLTSCYNLKGQWNDINCDNKREYVCEKSLFDII